MPAEPFDDLARALSASTSRRQALRLLVGAAFAGLLPRLGGGSLAPGSARAAENCLVEYPPADLDNCPNRRSHPGNVREVNGCGSQGVRPPQSWGKANLAPDCNQHDLCYETCNNGKAECDMEFLIRMTETCDAAYPDLSSTLKRLACRDVATVYYAAVAATPQGAQAYEDAQKKDCECCHPVPKIYCNCNKQCYDSATACTDACKASLGCFTGICTTAEPGQCPA